MNSVCSQIGIGRANNPAPATLNHPHHPPQLLVTPMPADIPKASRYPLLETVLAYKGLPLKAVYSLADAAALFDVSKRSIQSRVARGQLNARNLPGRAKFLSSDLEDFLAGRKP